MMPMGIVYFRIFLVSLAVLVGYYAHGFTDGIPPPINTSETIQVAAIMCGKHYQTQVGPFIASLMQNNNASLARLNITLFSDGDGIMYLTPCLTQLNAVGRFNLVHINTYQMPPLLMKLSDNLPRWKCGLNKLALYDMFSQAVSKLIFIDVDTIVQEDLSSLWNEFYKQPNKVIYAAWEDNASSTMLSRWPFMGVNTGVMLLDLQQMRSRNIGLDAIVASFNGSVAELGDQTYLNSWLSQHPNELGVLPCKWNKRSNICPEYKDPIYRHVSGIAHGPNNAFHKHWDFPYAYKHPFNKLCGWAK